MRIEHILEAIGKIERYTVGLTEVSFAEQGMAVDAVIRPLPAYEAPSKLE